jgi:hypothetical protein
LHRTHRHRSLTNRERNPDCVLADEPKLKTGAVEPLCKPTIRPSDIGNGGEASCLRGEAQPRDILQKLLKIVPRGAAHGSIFIQKGHPIAEVRIPLEQPRECGYYVTHIFSA